MTVLSDADLVKKKAYIDILMNVATLFAELDTASLSEGKYITNKRWSTITDADVEQYGVTAADVGNFVTLMTQFTRLMTNQATTPLEGRKFADMMRSR
jgi:hypothetical protein